MAYDLVNAISTAVAASAAVASFVAASKSARSYSRGIEKIAELHRQGETHADELWREGRQKIDRIGAEFLESLNQKTMVLAQETQHRLQELSTQQAGMNAVLATIKAEHEQMPERFSLLLVNLRQQLQSELYQALKKELGGGHR